MEVLRLMRSKAIWCGLALFALSAGCSKTDSPFSPAIEKKLLPAQVDKGAHSLLGLWTMNVDPSGAWEATPLRAGDFHMNIRKWLEEPAQLLKVVYAHALPHNMVKARIEITHPFNQPSLWGFDVRGICILPGSRQYPSIGQWVS